MNFGAALAPKMARPSEQTWPLCFTSRPGLCMLFAPNQGCTWWPLRAAQCGQPSGPHSIPAVPRLLPGCSQAIKHLYMLLINLFVCKYSCMYLLVFVNICMYLYYVNASATSVSLVLLVRSAACNKKKSTSTKHVQCQFSGMNAAIMSGKWKNEWRIAPSLRRGRKLLPMSHRHCFAPPPWAIAEDATAPVWAVTRAANLGLLRTIWLYDYMIWLMTVAENATAPVWAVTHAANLDLLYHLSQSFSQIKACR